MQQRGDKHGPLQDDYLKSETQGLERADHETRAEEWRAQEAPADDQPEPDRVPGATYTGEPPPGMSAEDVEGRAEIARFLDRTAFPATRSALVDDLREHNAPQHIVDLVGELPADREFRNVQEAWSALGGGVEEGRF